MGPGGTKIDSIKTRELRLLLPTSVGQTSHPDILCVWERVRRVFGKSAKVWRRNRVNRYSPQPPPLHTSIPWAERERETEGGIELA